jgi:hypothetical protein
LLDIDVDGLSCNIDKCKSTKQRLSTQNQLAAAGLDTFPSFGTTWLMAALGPEAALQTVELVVGFMLEPVVQLR